MMLWCHYLARPTVTPLDTSVNDAVMSLSSKTNSHSLRHSCEWCCDVIIWQDLRSLDSCNDVLVLFDLSTTFDTCNHDVLLARLHSYFAFDGIILCCFSSYLSARSITVSVNGITSFPRNLLVYLKAGFLACCSSRFSCIAPRRMLSPVTICRGNVLCWWYSVIHISKTIISQCGTWFAIRFC